MHRFQANATFAITVWIFFFSIFRWLFFSLLLFGVIPAFCIWLLVKLHCRPSQIFYDTKNNRWLCLQHQAEAICVTVRVRSKCTKPCLHAEIIPNPTSQGINSCIAYFISWFLHKVRFERCWCHFITAGVPVNCKRWAVISPGPKQRTKPGPQGS